jgi:hypothetical protein
VRSAKGTKRGSPRVDGEWRENPPPLSGFAAGEHWDQVMVSEQFYDHSRNRLWLFDGLTINNDHLNDEDHKATGTGDRGVVMVKFQWKPV